MLTDDMQRIITEQRLGFVATIAADGSPAVSPKATFAIIDDATIGFADIRSPGTLRNLAANPNVEVNFVDPFMRRGYRFKGTARVVDREAAEFKRLLPHFKAYESLTARMRAIVLITVTRALPVLSPAYDDGATEAELRAQWMARFRSLQPGSATKSGR